MKGEAYELIKSLLLEDSSYEIALLLLRKRYEDDRLILREIMGALHSAPSAQNHNAASLRRLVSTFQDKVTCLENLGLESGYFALSYLLMTKLDQETRRNWEAQLVQVAQLTALAKEAQRPGSGKSKSSGGDADEDERSNQQKWDAEYKQLMAFLFERLQVMERSEHRVPGQGAPRKQSNAAAKASAPAMNQTSSQKSGGQNPGYKSGGGSKKPTECPQCRKKDHLYLSKCPDFIKMNVQQRHAAVRRIRICYNCLSTSHMVRDCTSNFACKICGKQKHHHTLLHTDDKGQPQAQAAPAAEPAAEGKPIGGAALHIPDGSRHDGSRPDENLAADADGFRQDTEDGAHGSDPSEPTDRPSGRDPVRTTTTDPVRMLTTLPVLTDPVQPMTDPVLVKPTLSVPTHPVLLTRRRYPSGDPPCSCVLQWYQSSLPTVTLSH